jgi:hypothetical protein
MELFVTVAARSYLILIIYHPRTASERDGIVGGRAESAVS